MLQYRAGALSTLPRRGHGSSEVWVWSEWTGNDGEGDTGIDLVARERDESGYCAIQCKFYNSDHYLQKKDIDSFFTRSGKQPFTSRLIISTTDKWGKNAQDALERQQIPVTRIGMAEIGQSPVVWDVVWPASPQAEISLEVAPKHALRCEELLPMSSYPTAAGIRGRYLRKDGSMTSTPRHPREFCLRRVHERSLQCSATRLER
jgi:hypothetical protein